MQVPLDSKLIYNHRFIAWRSWFVRLPGDALMGTESYKSYAPRYLPCRKESPATFGPPETEAEGSDLLIDDTAVNLVVLFVNQNSLCRCPHFNHTR